MKKDEDYLSSNQDFSKYSILTEAIEKIIAFTAQDISEISLRERRAIRINRENDIFSTTIDIRVKYGYDIQAKSLELQSRLAESMKSMLSIKFDRIDIRVLGVYT